MADGFKDRLAHAFNAFKSRDEKIVAPFEYGAQYGARPYQPRMNASSERTMLNMVYTRIGIDVASVDMSHVILDANNRYLRTVDSGLNNCLTVEANIDQGATAFRQDIAMSLMEEGTIAIVPVDTSLDPDYSTGFDIRTLRVGKIVAWYPKYVRVNLWNDETGAFEEVVVSKKVAAIVENPLYAVMNEPNSTLKRLIRKLDLLDVIDEQAGSGKLDMIIQLPYTIKTETKRAQAEQRRSDLEMQLKSSKFGIGYTDSTEKITQLNRPIENNIMEQVKYLTEMLYGQLGLTPEILNGTATEATMLNYNNRTVEPILTAISEAMKRTFLTKTARSQKHSIKFFRDPFKLVPISQIAEIADKFTRNEITSSNEIRQAIGMKPSGDPKAEELRNSNMPIADTGAAPAPTDLGELDATVVDTSAEDDVMMKTLDALEAEIDKLSSGG
jgi:hypothetical protein